MKNTIKPTRGQFNILRQICNLIPEHEVCKIARETGEEDKARTFSPWSHTVSLLDAQLTHCIGLNDLCDSLQLRAGPLSTIRGATPPSIRTSKKHNEPNAAETHQNSRTRIGQNEAAALENQRVSIANPSLWDGCDNNCYRVGTVASIECYPKKATHEYCEQNGPKRNRRSPARALWASIQTGKEPDPR